MLPDETISCSLGASRGGILLIGVKWQKIIIIISILGPINTEKIVKNTENIQGLVVHPAAVNLQKQYINSSFCFQKNR